jgi:hypothetical protein
VLARKVNHPYVLAVALTWVYSVDRLRGAETTSFECLTELATLARQQRFPVFSQTADLGFGMIFSARGKAAEDLFARAAPLPSTRPGIDCVCSVWPFAVKGQAKLMKPCSCWIGNWKWRAPPANGFTRPRYIGSRASGSSLTAPHGAPRRKTVISTRLQWPANSRRNFGNSAHLWASRAYGAIKTRAPKRASCLHQFQIS